MNENPLTKFIREAANAAAKSEQVHIRLDSGQDVSIAEAMELILATDEPLPCEVCGTLNLDDDDQFTFAVGARDVPVNDLDRDWAAIGKRLVRYCPSCDPKGYLWRTK